MKKNKRLFLDIHAIQSLPPSNINRDDTGSPKTAQYGGVKRARVSSQSWKRAIREYFYAHGEIANVGIRTLDIVRYIGKKITVLKDDISEEKALNMAKEILNNAKVSTTKDFKAKALFFLSDYQAGELARAAIEGIKDKNTLQQMLNEKPSVDIALFGRMVADDPGLNEDASSQVAHAISTHGVQTEFDFYTAVDDLSPEDNAGAEMLGTIEYNSSTLYRYANVAIHDLFRQLNNKQETVSGLRLFIEAFSNSLPTGKMNSFANQTLPDALLVIIRNDRPVNLVGAFEEPIKSKEGYVEKSIKNLSEEFDKVQKFTNAPLAAYYISMDDYDNLSKRWENKESLNALIEDLSNTLNNLLED